MSAVVSKSSRIAAVSSEVQAKTLQKEMLELEPTSCKPWSYHNRDRAWLNAALCADLIESIQKNGQIEPILVRRLERGFEIIAGVRRCFACTQIPGQKIWARVIDADDRTCMILMHAENADAKDISDFERACSLKQQMGSGLFKNQIDLAKALGCSQSLVSKMLSAADLLEYSWFEALFRNKLEVSIRLAYKLSSLLKKVSFKRKVEAEVQRLLSEQEHLGSKYRAELILKRLIQSVQTEGSAHATVDPLGIHILLERNQKALITFKRHRRGNLSLNIAPEVRTLKWESIAELCLKTIQDYCVA